MKEFPKVYADDRQLNMIQDAIVDAVNPILAMPLNNSNFLQDIDLVAGDNIINHGLGRDLLGWMVVRKNANEFIYDNQDSNQLPQMHLILNSSGDVTVSLVVF